ncbi:MAG: PAS domain S-box protein [Proteobacteria bacterium]|nr:PAS domain S-box protein [Pseudomonadota bacterium]
MFSSFFQFLDRLITPEDTADKNELSYSRERILSCGLLIAAFVGFFAYIAGLPHFIREGMWVIVTLDTVSYGLVLFMLFCRGLSYFFRATASILILYILGVYLLYKFGIYGPGMIWLFAFPVFSGILIGFRSSLIALAITAVSLSVIDFCVAWGVLHWEFPTLNLTERVIAIETDLMLLCIASTVAIGFILNRLQVSLAGEKESRDALEIEITERKALETALRESEQKYRMYFESVSDAIYTLNDKLEVTHVSPSASRLSGYAPEELIGRPFYELDVLAERYLDTAFSDCDRSLKGEPVDNIYEFKTKGGIRKLAEVHGAPLMQDDEIVGIITIARDITELHQAWGDLEQSRERFRETLELLPSIVFETDPEMRITYINTLGLSTFGYTQMDMESGLNALNIFHPDDVNKVTVAIKKLKNKEDIDPYVVRALKCDGSHISTLVNSALIRQKGKITGIRMNLNDITIQKNMEEELLKVRKLESVGLLAAGIAHDFNNILVSIMGNLTLALSHTAPDDKRYTLLENASKASINAKALTRQLLTFSKGGTPIKEVTSIEDVIRDSADFVLRGGNARCHFQFDENLRPIEIDKGQISQVIQNIIINAAQAMPRGGRIDIAVENIMADKKEHACLREANYLKITIRDNGIGIPSDIIDRIFDPYFTTKEKGNGLGLAVTHAIIAKHDGHISVESELDVGTTFTLYLPASLKGAACLVEKKEMRFTHGSGRIMIMDDEEMVRNIVTEILSESGYDVVHAKDGEEAIRLYREKPVDAVIMDLTIPGAMGGKDTIAELKKIDPDAKVIVSSGYSNDPIMANYKQYGFCQAIAKPYQFQELLRVVGLTLAGSDDRQ